MRYLLILLLLLCSSCIQLLGDPQPVHYYLLESLPEGTPSYSNKTLIIDLHLSSFPTYLDRPQVIILNQDNTIKFSDHDRWAEPLQGNIMQVMRENLRLALPAANITLSPWEKPAANTLKTKIMINKFSGKLKDQTNIDIRWEIISVTGEVRRGHFIDHQPVGDTYQDLVSSLNRGINRFSQKLAKNLIGG